MKDFINTMVGGSTLRQVLQFIFASIAGMGWISEDQGVTLAGAVASIVIVAWSAYVAKGRRETIKALEVDNVVLAKEANATPSPYTKPNGDTLVGRTNS